MVWAFPYLGTGLLTIIFMLSSYTLVRVVDLGNQQAAQVERDKAQDSLIATQAGLLAALTVLVDTMRERQSSRVPLFDEDHKKLQELDTRVDHLERGGVGR